MTAVASLTHAVLWLTTHGLHNCKDQRAAAAAFISVNSISQRKIKHQYNKMVQLNTAVQIGCFQHLYLA